MNLIFLFMVGILTGLSGTMIPGPLFLFTVSESLKKDSKVGIKIAFGHIIIEALLIVFILLIGAATLFTLKDWRRGIYWMILLGVIKDPIRKMIPGAPAYLALATVPVWAGILLGAWIENPRLWADFRNSYKRLSTAIVIFLLSLLPAAAKSATYSAGSWQVALLGLFSYSSVIFGLLIGFIYLRSEKDLKKIIVFYCTVTAIMLFGTPMEYLGVAKDWLALGTAALDTEWRQTSVYGVIVRMVAGFYRSPDVMGWHATALSMLALMLALRTSGLQRYFWIAVAGWGLTGAILCGRRKMIFMLPIFISVYCFIYWSVSKRIKLSVLLTITLISCGSGFLIYQKLGPSTEIEKYYLQDPNKIFWRVEKQTFHALIGTYRQSGILGEGLGTATQGAHRLRVTRPRTWQEGGLSRVLVELGIPGFICFLFLLLRISVSFNLFFRPFFPSPFSFLFSYFFPILLPPFLFLPLYALNKLPL